MSRAAGYDWLRRYGITSESSLLTQAELTERWRDGRSAGDLADEVGLAGDAIRERLVSAAVLSRPRSYYVVGSPDDPLPEHLLRDWYVREGFTVAQMAALTGTTARQVRYRLARYHLSPGRPGPPPRLRRALTETLLTELYVRDGLSCAQIGERSGVSGEAVRDLLASYGIERRAGRAARCR